MLHKMLVLTPVDDYDNHHLYEFLIAIDEGSVCCGEDAKEVSLT
jgi:hypothetical protein